MLTSTTSSPTTKTNLPSINLLLKNHHSMIHHEYNPSTEWQKMNATNRKQNQWSLSLPGSEQSMRKKKNIQPLNSIKPKLKRMLPSRNSLSHKNSSCRDSKNSNRKYSKGFSHSNTHACMSLSISCIDPPLFNIKIIILSSSQGDRRQGSSTNLHPPNELSMESNIK